MGTVSSTAGSARSLVVRSYSTESENHGVQGEEKKDSSNSLTSSVERESANPLDNNKTMSSQKSEKNNTKEEDHALERGIGNGGKQTNATFQYPLTNSSDLKKALKHLDLAPQDMRSGARIVEGNLTLFKYLKTAFETVVYMQELSIDGYSSYLDQLNHEFFDAEVKERTIVGDFLSFLKFGKASFSKYKEVLGGMGEKHFTDKMLQGEGKHSRELVVVIGSIRSHWWNFSDASSAFGVELSTEGVLQELVQDLVNLTNTDSKTLKFSFAFESAVGTLHNVAKIPKLRQTFRDLKVVDILGNFLNYEDLPKVTMLVLMILSLIIDEDQTSLLFSHESVFDLLLLLTKRAWTASDHRYDGFSLNELIVSLTGLSRNDQVKKLLVEKGALELVSDVLASGSDEEKELAAKWLWELSFDPDNKEKIKTHESLLQIVKDLSKNINSKIARSAQGALLVLGMDMNNTKKNFFKKAKKKKPSDVSEAMTENTGHIMISYNWADQRKLIQIRDVLQSCGFKLWMDIDNISGSTLQAMAEAVEQSAVVLVCMSEKYKESPNCRSEAEYAFSLQKPIIPLLMQFDYKPNGWLGILLGTKIFFNFSGKYDFESKIAELVREIGDRGKITSRIKNDGTDGPVVKETAIPTGKPPASAPSAQFDTSVWITENNLQKFTFLQSLKKEHLQFMKKLSQRAPEFYYSYLTDLLSGKITSENVDNLMTIATAVESLPR